MDSEKNTHMRELLESGKPVTDEGPFYHHAWWESYKGGIKGKLGGGALGAGMGAITGGMAVLGIAAVTTAFPPSALLIVGGFSAAGLIYGVHEFGEVGKIAGAVGAAEKAAEKRLKEFEDSRFEEISEQLGELKAIIKGEPVPEKTASLKADEIDLKQDDYRTSHFQGSKVEGLEKFIFWKVAMAGLIAGAAAGAVLVFGGAGEHLLHALGSAESGLLEAVGVKAVGKVLEASIFAQYATTMAAMGAVGASFGINRDLFRQAFDKTDLWFRGFVSHAHSQRVLLEKGSGNPVYVEEDLAPSIQEKLDNYPTHARLTTTIPKNIPESAPNPDREVVAYPNSAIQYPDSDTYHRDRVLAAAQKALVDMDHTKMSPH